MKAKYYSVILGIFLVFILVGAVMIYKMTRSWDVIEARGIGQVNPYSASGKTQGPDSAPVKILEYSDFECPGCAGSQEVIRDIFKKFPNQIQITFRHFPLTMHRLSPYAHQAAECAARQNRFWPYQDLLFHEQRVWAKTPDPTGYFLQYAQNAGLDMNAFTICMADAEVTQAIYTEKQEGSAAQINSTPTFIIGKERFVGPTELKEQGIPLIERILKGMTQTGGIKTEPENTVKEMPESFPVPLNTDTNKKTDSPKEGQKEN